MLQHLQLMHRVENERTLILWLMLFHSQHSLKTHILQTKYHQMESHGLLKLQRP